MTSFTSRDRQYLEGIFSQNRAILKLLNTLSKTGEQIVSKLDDVAAATSAIESEVKVAADALHELASKNNDPALADIASRLTAAHDNLKTAVDSVMASGGTT